MNLVFPQTRMLVGLKFVSLLLVLIWHASVIPTHARECDFKTLSLPSLRNGFWKTVRSPLLIRDASWHSEYASVSAFQEAFGNVTVFKTSDVGGQSRTGIAATKIETTFREWTADLADGSGAFPYVFLRCSESPSCDGRVVDVYGIPPVFRDSSRILFIAAGAETPGFPLHSHRQTWARAIAGTKVWYVAPPGNPPLAPYQTHSEEALAKAGLKRCTQREGDIVYLPKEWWHATYSKSEWTLTAGGQENSDGSGYDAARGNLTGLGRLKKFRNGEAHIAAENGHTQVLELIAAKRVDLSKLRYQGRYRVPQTIKFQAAKSGHVHVLGFLASKGVDLSEKEADGDTAADTATTHGHVGVLELLLRNRVDLSARGAGGGTLGHTAAEFGHVPILELLSTQGVDLFEEDGEGKTPAMYARDERQTRVLEWLDALPEKGMRGAKAEL